MANTDRLIEILEKAESLVPGVDRDAFLTEACAGEPELKEQVISLLKAHESAGDFLVDPVLAPPALITEIPGSWIGRYRILEKLGEGGCGVVYVAEQTEPVRRRVALKVIKLGMDTKQLLARFEAERQALAMMDHPNIARVLDAASTEMGRPYFVMELVRGVRITQFCHENQLSMPDCLALFVKVCGAIQHAHQKGIIHRDIKPSNILVTLHDGVPVPKVIDFGIAKAIEGRLTDATIYTRLLQFVGTPAYMSPEQAEMSGLDIDTRSDIYSLGVLLYELLTGETPFDGEKLIASGIDEMRKTIREAEPTRPSTKLCQTLAGDNARRVASKSPIRNFRAAQSPIHSDLDWIVLKCLEKDRTRRYETATGLAADLLRHLSDEPVQARPASSAYKLWKAWRRNRVTFSATAAVALALLVGTGVSAWQAVVARQARTAAEKEKAAAQRQAYIANMFSAGPAWEENNYEMVHQILADTRSSPDRGFEWFYWQRQTHLHLKALYGHVQQVKSIAFFPDGQQIVTGSEDKSARVWDIGTGKVRRKLLGHKASVNSVAVSRDGKQIATASSDQTVIVWDSIDGRELLSLQGHWGSIDALAFSQDGQRLVTGGADGIGRIWDLATRQVIVTLEGFTNSINSVAFSPDGEKIVTASNDRNAQVWRSADGKLLFPLGGHNVGHKRAIRTVAFSADGRRIITGSLDQSVRFWDAETGENLPPNIEAKEPVVTLSSSRDGRRVVTGSWSSVARVWNGSNRQIELIIRGHVRALNAVAISPDGTRVVTGSNDSSVKVWNADGDPHQLRVEGNPTNSVLAVAISPHGERIAIGSGTFNNDGSTTGSGDQALQIWDAEMKQNVLTISGHTSGVSSVTFSPDGAQILSGSGDHTAKLWDGVSGGLLSTLRGHAGSVSSVAFFPSGDRIVTGSQDQTARVWNVATGLPLFVLAGHAGPVSSVAVSPDGKRVVAGSFDTTVRVWDAATGRLVRIIPASTVRICSVSFSPDSRRIVIGGWGKTTVWEVDEINRDPLTLPGYGPPVSSVIFSPDGLRLITGSLNGLAKVWEVATGRELLTLRGHTEFIYAVAISADGQRIITGSADRTVRIWEAATTNQVASWEAEERAAANSGSSR